MPEQLHRRRFLGQATVIGSAIGASSVWAAQPAGPPPEPLKPIGEAKGIHPGRVVWVHDPRVLDWNGPADGHWYEGGRTKQDRVDAMLVRAVCELTGESSSTTAWDKLFRHFNRRAARATSATGPARGSSSSRTGWA